MTFIDSNVLLDVVTDGETWVRWSQTQLDQAALRGPLLINDIVYSEVSTRFASVEVLNEVLSAVGVEVAAIPRSALFLAGKVYLRYRASGGIRTGVLSDFFIGAHASVAKVPLLTRDARRYRTYFPDISIIAPDILPG